MTEVSELPRSQGYQGHGKAKYTTIDLALPVIGVIRRKMNVFFTPIFNSQTRTNRRVSMAL